jgi:hypothetical protein
MSASNWKRTILLHTLPRYHRYLFHRLANARNEILQTEKKVHSKYWQHYIVFTTADYVQVTKIRLIQSYFGDMIIFDCHTSSGEGKLLVHDFQERVQKQIKMQLDAT